MKRKRKLTSNNVDSFSNAEKIKNFFKLFANRKVIVSIFITLVILIIFRIGSLVSMPGVKFISSTEAANALQSNNLLGLMNMLGGGGLTQVSIFALGVSPYINAQIIMQLLSTDLVKPISDMLKSGEAGKRKYEI